MRGLRALLMVGLLVALLPSPASGAAPGNEQIQFVCPSAVAQLPTQPADCPLYVLDLEDLFGQPDLVVDPVNPNVMAFGALHGGSGLHPLPNDQPPSPRSRASAVHQPHTTFTTANGGKDWQDQPYYPPSSVDPPASGPLAQSRSREVYGEDDAIAVDGGGRLAIAALYAFRDSTAGLSVSAAPPGYQYAVALWREGKINGGMSYGDDGHVIVLPAGLKADTLRLTYVAATDSLVATWRQEDASNRSEVGGAWAPGAKAGAWTDLDANKTPAGCATLSRAFASGDALVFACGHADRAPEVVALETRNWTTASRGALPLPPGGEVGMVPLEGTSEWAAWRAGVGAGKPLLDITMGQPGEWRKVQSLGADVAPADLAGTPLLEARVTAAQYVPASGNLHLVFEAVRASADAPGKPAVGKTFVSIQAHGGVQASLDLGLGKITRADVSPTSAGLGEGSFDDVHDSLVLWTPPGGGEPQEYLAFGDYGFVRFAQVVERDFAPPLVPLAVQAPPVPAASPGTIPALVAAPAGILAGAAMARVALARRKQTVESRDE